MQPCYFLGSGVHTSLGADIASQLTALQRPPTAPPLITINYAGKQQQLPYNTLALADIDDAHERLNYVVDGVVAQALEAAQLSASERAAMGFFLGTSSFDISIEEQEFCQALTTNPHAIALANCTSQAKLGSDLRRRYGLRGPEFTFNTACSSSANALAHADDMIRSGQLQHALILGIELRNSITALGFNGLQLLSPGAMRPFDHRRNGIVLGEGCAALVLGNRRPNKKHQWHLKGSANLCDTHSMSGTNVDGSNVGSVINGALHNAKLSPQQITAIKTHGTASLANDVAEAAGMKRIFDVIPPLTSLKPFIGHTLGACGLNEMLLFCAALDAGFLIATPDIGNNDETHGDTHLGVRLNQQLRELPAGNFLMNCFGFGGNNTVLVVSNQDD